MPGIIALAFAYVMSQFYRSFLAVLTPVLSSELGMTNNQLSQALAAWFVVFALSQFLVGPMLDRLGPKLTAALLFFAGAGGGAAMFAVASAPWMVIVAMGAIGLGCSPVLMATLYIFRAEFSAKRFAFLSSTFIAFGNAGNLLGTSPLASLADAYGWRLVMGGLCAVTVAIAVATLLLVKNPHVSGGPDRDNGSYWRVFSIPALWPIFPMCLFGYAIIANIRGLWAGPYFDQVHGLAATEIGSITFFVAVAMVIGSLAYGPMDTLFNSRKWVVLGGNGLTIVALAAWAFNPLGSVEFVSGALVVMGLAGMFYGVVMAHCMAYVPADLTGRGVTLINFFSIGGTGLMQGLSGFVYDASAVSGDEVSGFSAVIWLYLAASVFASVVYIFSKDAKPSPS
ncbi:MFS transporter [Pseudahrensia aquimaris]|uniref:MFS transporter n=1 Tax=Pseudahrensia aquimaris TaxID=744461 RepID=A0ABW3FII4_9HYPH